MHRRLKLILKPFRTMTPQTRIIVGLLLLLGGLLGALPILGFWMLPLGLLVLSLDFRWARRGYLSVMVWFRRRREWCRERTQHRAPNNNRPDE